MLLNRKQWIVFGIGLILLGFYTQALAGMNDCDKLLRSDLEIVENIDNDLNTLGIVTLLAKGNSADCFDFNTLLGTYAAILTGIGILFIIMGFLEKKK
jgi:hypothetical protein